MWARRSRKEWRRRAWLKLRFLFLALSAIWISGCGSVPNASDYTHSRFFYRRPKFVGTEGRPISTAAGKEIVAKLEQSAGKTDILKRHMAFEEALTGVPLTLGNKATLLQDGPDTYKAMFDAIRDATDSINVEVYIFSDDSVGQKFADALIAKQRSGVQVNLIYDSFGSHRTPRSFFAAMTEAGIQVLEFNPVNPLSARLRWSPNRRDHRKLTVIDGKIAFTGGINISGEYESASRGRKIDPAESWRDTDVEIEGPAVAEFQHLFIDTWQKQNGPALKPLNYFPPLDKKGDEIVRVIGSEPEQFSLIYVDLISAINNAESKIYITDAYFAPGREMIEALEAAVGRGVDVRLLVPGQIDEPLISLATRSDYSGLLQSGVQIYEWQGKMIHSKTATIDDVWSTVGSMNLDWWSIARNNEISAVILSYGFAKQMEFMFNADLERSDKIDPQQWEHRAFTERGAELIGRVLKPVL
jgi:cardiolipin synthase